MIETAVCKAFDMDCWAGVHQPGDEWRLVLLRAGATAGPDTASLADVQRDELPGSLGYPAGGLPLAPLQAEMVDGMPCAGWGEAVFSAASFSAAGGVVINASKGGRAAVVLDFGGVYVGNGTAFRVPLARVIQRAGNA